MSAGNTARGAESVFYVKLANFVVVTSLHFILMLFFDTILRGGLAVNISLLISRVSVYKQAWKSDEIKFTCEKFEAFW